MNSRKLRTGEKLWMDRAFENEIIGLTQQAKQAFDKMVFRDALKFSFFDFATARDSYRHLAAQQGMHHESVWMWIETQVVILSPMAPHITENIWTNRLKKPTLVVNQPWPTFPDREYDHVLHRELECLFSSVEEFRKMKEKTVLASKKQMKGKSVSAPILSSSSLTSAVIYVAKDYLPWQQTVLKLLQAIPLDETQRAPLDAGFMMIIKSHPELASLDKKLTKEVLPFASFRMKVKIFHDTFYLKNVAG